MPRVRATFNKQRGLMVPELLIHIHPQGFPPFEFSCLANSGADWTILPGEVVEGNDIAFASLNKLPPGEGAGGSFEVRGPVKGTLKWREWVFADQFFVSEPHKCPALLGREDFFKAFIVEFRWHLSPPTFSVEPIGKTKKKAAAVAKARAKTK